MCIRWLVEGPALSELDEDLLFRDSLLGIEIDKVTYSSYLPDRVAGSRCTLL
jgi:hypothetical protein